jgi:23S rRNA pseudoU1915 N3-methylase RlmH
MQLLNTPHLLSNQKDTEMWEVVASGTVSAFQAHKQQLQDASQLLEQASAAAVAAEQSAAALRAAEALAKQVQESARQGLEACMVAEGGASRVLQRMTDRHKELLELQFQKAMLTSMIERGEIGVC